MATRTKTYTPITTLDSASVRDTVDNAIQAKLHFGDNYEMYVSYLSQWRAGEGRVGITPLSEQEYTNLVAVKGIHS